MNSIDLTKYNPPYISIGINMQHIFDPRYRLYHPIPIGAISMEFDGFRCNTEVSLGFITNINKITSVIRRIRFNSVSKVKSYYE